METPSSRMRAVRALFVHRLLPLRAVRVVLAEHVIVLSAVPLLSAEPRAAEPVATANIAFVKRGRRPFIANEDTRAFYPAACASESFFAAVVSRGSFSRKQRNAGYRERCFIDDKCAAGNKSLHESVAGCACRFGFNRIDLDTGFGSRVQRILSGGFPVARPLAILSRARRSAVFSHSVATLPLA